MKLAIIEDRMRRLGQFQDFDISKQQNSEIITGNAFNSLKEELHANEIHSLDGYTVIAAHRSALDLKARDALKTYCTNSKKPLVFFSGGITYSIFKDVDFPFLYLNSKDFYSGNLKTFLNHLEEGQLPNLLILQFGLQWKMSLLLGLRNHIAVAQSKQLIRAAGGDDIEMSELIRRVQDLRINDLIKEDLINDQTREILTGNVTAAITSEQIDEIKSAIDHQINRML